MKTRRSYVDLPKTFKTREENRWGKYNLFVDHLEVTSEYLWGFSWGFLLFGIFGFFGFWEEGADEIWLFGWGFFKVQIVYSYIFCV